MGSEVGRSHGNVAVDWMEDTASLLTSLSITVPPQETGHTASCELRVYTSHGPTVVMPTWFCSRNLFLKVGPFDKGGKGVPEDLLFFYQSLRLGGGLSRVDQCLLVYRYHEKAATHSVT
ncbi:UDP-GlcNAc:betaGal beta-1,3-N-acetylglucosaminyltransferase-like protein 1, partial [Lates japonicus]